MLGFIVGLPEALVIVFGTVLAVTIAMQIGRYMSYRQELDFKREMIDRGMSIEEVEQLLTAQSWREKEK